jgi:hypothetical protein
LVTGCAEDVSTAELTKLSATATKPKQEEKPADTSATAPAPEPSDTQDAGNADASTGSTSNGYGGYGAVGPGAPQDETYGQGAPIKLKSEVDNPDLAKAEGGVGKRGQGYGGGIITEPIRQRFVLEDRIKFMNMQNTLKFYRAEHNDRNPPTIQEFVEKIVTESGLTLPELPPGHFYVYDPSAKNLDEVLLVDQSQNQQQ